MFMSQFSSTADVTGEEESEEVNIVFMNPPGARSVLPLSTKQGVMVVAVVVWVGVVVSVVWVGVVVMWVCESSSSGDADRCSDVGGCCSVGGVGGCGGDVGG